MPPETSSTGGSGADGSAPLPAFFGLRELPEPPTPAEQIALAKRIERGDLRAKEEMVRRNLRLAVSEAARYQGAAEWDDLVQEAVMGLMRAVELFDWRRGFRFSTYAVAAIRSYLRRYIAHNRSILKVNSKRWQAIQQLSYLYDRARQAGATHGDAAREAAGHLELDGLELAALTSALHPVRLDKPAGDEPDGTTRLDLLPDTSPRADTERVAIARADLSRTLRRARTLDRTERAVFGARMLRELSVSATARELGLTRERVVRVERVARDKLAAR